MHTFTRDTRHRGWMTNSLVDGHDGRCRAGGAWFRSQSLRAIAAKKSQRRLARLSQPEVVRIYVYRVMILRARSRNRGFVAVLGRSKTAGRPHQPAQRTTSGLDSFRQSLTWLFGHHFRGPLPAAAGRGRSGCLGRANWVICPGTLGILARARYLAGRDFPEDMGRCYFSRRGATPISQAMERRPSGNCARWAQFQLSICGTITGPRQ